MTGVEQNHLGAIPRYCRSVAMYRDSICTGYRQCDALAEN
jgi:hypothetical protein